MTSFSLRAITLTAGLTNAHSGTAPTQAEVGNLTRNVKIIGASASLQGYIDIKAGAIVDLDYVEMYWLGSATANKRGIDIATTSAGSCNIAYCSIHDFAVASSIGLFINATTGNGVVLSNNVVYNVSAQALSITQTNQTGHTVDGNLFMLNTAANTDLVVLTDTATNYTNNTACGAVRGGVYWNENANNPMGTVSGNTSHSNGQIGWNMAVNTSTGTITDTKIWRNNSTAGISLGGGSDNITFDGLDVFGNSGANILLASVTDITFDDMRLNGDTSFSTTYGIQLSTNFVFGNIRINNADMGSASGILVAHSGADIQPASCGGDIYMHNTILASTTEVGSMSGMSSGSVISSMAHDQTPGLHKAWMKRGEVSIDTTAGLYDSTPSVRMTPNSATNKRESVLFRAAVASGNTATVSVKVRESVVGDGTDYNGNRIRLIVKKNVAAGISADTVLATATVASEGAFETISGTTASVTSDCILEFAVDCDGTTGWINADTFTAPTAESTLGMNYWRNGIGYGYGDNSTGGGGSSSGGAYIGAI